MPIGRPPVKDRRREMARLKGARIDLELNEREVEILDAIRGDVPRATFLRGLLLKAAEVE